MICTAALLGFAWFTGILIALALEFQEQQIQLIVLRREQLKPTTETSKQEGTSKS